MEEQEQQKNMQLEIGHRYLLLEKIKEDTYFQVFVAYDKLRRVLVKIKLLDAQYLYDFRFLEDLRKALHVAFRLAHKHLMKPVDFGRDTNAFFIVEEHEEGEYLDRLLAREDWDIQKAHAILLQVGQALNFLENEGLIHGGIRSASIFFTKNGEAKLSDLGIFCIREEKRLTDIHLFGVLAEEVFYRTPHKFSIPGEKEALIRSIISRAKHAEGFASVAEMVQELRKLSAAEGETKISYVPVSELAQPRITAAKEDVLASLPPTPEATQALKDLKEELQQKISAARKENDMPLPAHEKKSGLKDNETAESPRKTKPSAPAALGKQYAQRRTFVMASAAVLVCAFLLVKLFFLVFPPRKDVQVPNLVGKTVEETMLALKSQNLRFNIMGYEPSDKYPKDAVMWQAPIPGTMLKEGKTVHVHVSTGVEMVAVPDVRGLPLLKAKDMLFQTKLSAGHVKMSASATVEKGKILMQDPPPGSSQPVKTTVSLLVSSGPEKQKVTVPNLVGLSLEEGKNMLKEGKLAVGGVTSRESADTAAGEILEQKPPAGGELLEGEKVSLVVAKKPKDTSQENTNENASSTAAQTSTATAAQKKTQKQAEVDIVVPPGPVKQLVKIIVLDEEGAKTLYQKFHKPKDHVKLSVPYVGKATIQVFMDEELVKEREL